jgi:hypothetical protein
LFDFNQDFYEKVFEATARAINDDPKVIPPDKQLLPLVKKVKPGDNFGTISELCSMFGVNIIL